MDDEILVIGETDLTPWIIMDNLKISETAAYDETDVFTNVYGQDRRTRIGTEVTISVDLTGVPEEDAAVILGECESDTVSANWCAPLPRSGNFPRPSTAVTVSFEEEDRRIYDIRIEMSGKIPLDGL